MSLKGGSVRACSKGQAALDVLLLVIVLIIVGLAALVGHLVQSNVNEEIQASSDMSAESKAAMQSMTAQYPRYMDNAFLTILILFWVILLVSSFLIDSHPVFFIIMAVLMIFVFIVVMVVANTYGEIASDDAFIAFAADFPIMSWVFSHLLMVIIFVGFTTLIALYAKNVV